MNRRAEQLTPVGFQILLALAGGEKHGYALMQEIEHRTAGDLRPGPGTLYRTIGALLENGWIAEVDERPAPELDDARRRYYRLTDLGHRVAVDETSRLAGLVRQATTQLHLSGEPK
jgi:DNA-binding PadR family transcriptional regulator